MLSDYPARGGRTGYAVGLDTAASAAEILQLLAAEGYDTGRHAMARSRHRARCCSGHAEQIDDPDAGLSRGWLAASARAFSATSAKAWGDPRR